MVNRGNASKWVVLHPSFNIPYVRRNHIQPQRVFMAPPLAERLVGEQPIHPDMLKLALGS
jgi:hypothetical protein